MTTNDIVGKLWNLCNVLKDDGITYHQYGTCTNDAGAWVASFCVEIDKFGLY